MLHISYEEQRERLLARLDDPTKRWKFNPSDLDDRDRWADYQRAYADALTKCGAGARSVVRRAGRPQVVPQLGGGQPAAGPPGRDGASTYPAVDLDIGALAARLADEPAPDHRRRKAAPTRTQDEQSVNEVRTA